MSIAWRQREGKGSYFVTYEILRSNEIYPTTYNQETKNDHLQLNGLTQSNIKRVPVNQPTSVTKIPKVSA